MTVIGRMCLIRTINAGVHFGEVAARDGRAQEVWLLRGRRIWQWHGANTLHEIALRGCSNNSRISEPVPEQLLSGVIEIIPLTDEAVAILARCGWTK